MAIDIEPAQTQGFWISERKQPQSIEGLWNFAYRISRKQLGNDQDAEDNAQEAIYKSLKEGNSFKDGSPYAWFARICTNQGYDTLRRRWRRPQTSLEGHFEEGLELESTHPQYDPELTSQRAELKEVIRRGLEMLSPSQRSAIILCDLEGLKYDEAARALNVQVGTIKSRLSRGRASLRQQLIHQRYTP